MVQPDGKKIVLFDGLCNLCTGSARFIIKRDSKKVFSFASLQSQTGRGMLRHLPFTSETSNSFLLWDDGKIYNRSSAALRVLKYCTGAWRVLYVLILIPPFLRDAIYDWVARHRYRWFGKRNECWIPTPELKARFLD